MISYEWKWEYSLHHYLLESPHKKDSQCEFCKLLVADFVEQLFTTSANVQQIFVARLLPLVLLWFKNCPRWRCNSDNNFEVP